MLDWIKKQKDLLTTIAGIIAFIGALINYIQQFIASGSGDMLQLIVGIVLFVIGWFTGKSVEK